jgi:negative regulator of flagellin synthesis FlgM
MIISNQQIQSIAKLYKDQTTTSRPMSKEKTVSVGKDEVILSPKAQEFSQIYQKIKALPEVRPERVAELTARIDAGTYQVPARAIAEKMLENLKADQ